MGFYRALLRNHVLANLVFILVLGALMLATTVMALDDPEADAAQRDIPPFSEARGRRKGGVGDEISDLDSGILAALRVLFRFHRPASGAKAGRAPACTSALFSGPLSTATR